MLAAVDALARLHDFDWHRAGMADLGRPAGFHERQVARWIRQLRSWEGRELPDMDSVAGWLRTHMPAGFSPALMHGDYHMMNILMRLDDEPAVAAIVDWETATIGDPLLDLAGFCEIWARYGGTGWPPAGEVTQAYYTLRGFTDVPDLRYYRVLFNFRHAVLLEGIFQRAQRDPVRGPQPDIGEMSLHHMRQAATLTTGEW